MPKGVEYAYYNSFVFNEEGGERNGGFCGFRRTWLTSAKSGGFRPAGLSQGRSGVQGGCGYLVEKHSDEPSLEHCFTEFRLGKNGAL